MASAISIALSESSLFRGLSEGEVSELLQRHRTTLRNYHHGSIVAFRGDRYNELWIIVEGDLRAEFQNHRGKVLKVETLKSRDLVASSVLFAPQNYLPVTLIAEGEVKICRIARRNVLNMLQEDSRILHNYLEDTGMRLSLLAEKLNMLQFSTIREKISHFLLDEIDKQGSEVVRLPISKEALAEVFGVTRPALSREFSHLCEQGILEQSGSLITIHDSEALLDIVEAP